MSDDPIKRLADAQGELDRIRSLADQALAAVHAAIAHAAESGVKQRDIVEITGLSRERVRQICRDAGVRP